MSAPLASLRVVELGGIGPAPFAGMMLADHGADVITLERIGGTGLAAAPPDQDPLRRGKRSLAIDLKSDAGRDLARRLCTTADVVIEGFRPGVAARLGLDYATLRADNPKLVYGHMTGWGQTGPRAQSVGHDLNYIAMTGVLNAIGASDRPPPPPLNVVGDFGGGSAVLVVGILAQVLAARDSGEGAELDGAIVDGVSYLASSIHALSAMRMWSDKREANFLDGGAPFYAVYATRDDRFLSVAALEGKFWRNTLHVLGLSEDAVPAQFDMKRWPELRATIARRIAERNLDEWVSAFDGVEACVDPVLTFTEARRDAHLAARHTFLDGGAFPQVAPAPHVMPTRPASALPIPGYGAQGRDILLTLGLDADAIERLISAGTIAFPETGGAA